MNSVTEPVQQIRRHDTPRMAIDWLDALVIGDCDQAAFLAGITSLLRESPDAGWDLLAYLDQYYRRGKIPAESFGSLKSHLERLLLGKGDGEPAAATTTIQPIFAESESASRRGPTPEHGVESAGMRPRSNPDGSNSPARSASQPLGAGDWLRGRYRIVGVLGRGGMGVVYLAVDSFRLEEPADDQRVALKVLHSEVVKRPRLLDELRREFRHLQKLAHPNIVRVHEFDRDGELAFFTMEYLTGAPLARLLALPESYAFNRTHALIVARAVGAAIAHAHSRGVVHGDLNPGNIFITDTGAVRVLDFGASHQLHHGPWISEFDAQPHMAVATASFASCQILEGEAGDARDDVYAFACVLYLLLAGRHPFGGETALKARARRQEPRRPPGLQRAQWRALREGLMFERDKRPSTMPEWLARLGLNGGAEQLPPLRDLRPIAHPARRSVGRAVAIGMLAGVLLGGFWLSQQPGRVAEAWGALQTRLDALRARPAATIPEPTPPTAEPALVSAPAATAASTRPAQASTTPVAPAAKATRSTVDAATTPTPATPVTPSPSPAEPLPPVAAAALPSAQAAAPATATGAPPAHMVAPTAAAGAGQPPAGIRARIEMAADNVELPQGELMARIEVHRTRSLREDVSFNWWTESGTATPGRDFVPVKTRVEHMEKGKDSVSLIVPLIDDRPHSKPRSFYVVIDEPSDNAGLGPRNLTMVTIPGSE